VDPVGQRLLNKQAGLLALGPSLKDPTHPSKIYPKKFDVNPGFQNQFFVEKAGWQFFQKPVWV
jgi:hypothetical protein